LSHYSFQQNLILSNRIIRREETGMSDLPRRVRITEEGPREGFQIATTPVPTADKIALIDALSATGAPRIQVASFVSPRRVPGWADADAVVAGFAPQPWVAYTALWFNPLGSEGRWPSRSGCR